ncbi:MAG: hypothetical protein ACPGOY_01725 [Rhodospirillaceae bacterium]
MSTDADRPLANDYGFVGVGAGETQQAGFFVDDQDRILYWPDKSGPGLVFDTDTGLRLLRSAEKLSRYVLSGLYLSSFAFLLVTVFTKIFFYHYFSEWFSWFGLLFTVIIGHIVVPIIVWAVAWRLVIRVFLYKKWQRHSIEILQSRRPVPILLDFSCGECDRKLAVDWIISPIVTITCPIIAVCFVEKLGDQLGLWLLSILIAFSMWHRLWKPRNRVSIPEVRTLITLPKGMMNKLSQPKRPFGQTIMLGLITIWRRIFFKIMLISFVFVIVLSFHFVALNFSKENMPPEMLVEAYLQSVFPSEASRVKAWTGPVTVCIGPSEDGPRARIVGKQKTLWEATGLDVTFAETNCSVDIVFLTESRSSKDEDNPPMGGMIHYAGEQLDRILIEISVKDYGYLEPGAYVGDRYAMNNLELSIADTAGMWALGIPGRYEFDGTFTDHTGERVYGSALIAQMHYHPSIPHGATLEQVRPLLQGIAQELLKYPADDVQRSE